MTVPGNLSSPLLATAAAAAAGPADTGRSLRFNSGDSTHLARTPSSAGNRKTFTFSCWFKRTKIGESHLFLDSQNGIAGNPRGSFQIDQDDRLRFAANPTGSSWTVNVKSNNLLRDTAAWYHLVCSIDTTQSTSSNRIRLYINNEEVSYHTTSYASQNTDLPINQALEHRIGSSSNNSLYVNGYLANIVFVDGSQLTPSSFGAYDSNGVWQHADYSGTYGTQGYELKFTDGSSLGDDTSGNDNDWTPANLTGQTPVSYSGTSSITVNNSNSLQVGSLAAVFNGTQDANATNAYGFSNGAMDFTWTPNTAISYSSKVRVWTGFSGGSVFLNGGSAVSSQNNNWTTLVSGSSGTITSIRFTVGQSGGWWAGLEVDDVVLTDGNPSDLDLLFDNPTNGAATDSGAGGEVIGNYAILNPLNMHNSNNSLTNGNLEFTTSGSDGGLQESTIAMSSGKFYFEVVYSRSGTGQFAGIRKPGARNYNDSYIYVGTAQKYIDGGSGTGYGATLAHGDVIGTAFDADNGTLEFFKNGTSQGTAFTGISGTYSFFVGSFGAAPTGIVNFGARPFSYAAPSGFKTLNTASLPTATVPDGSDYFDTKLYTGNGDGTNTSDSGPTLTTSFSPDFLWGKSRSLTKSHFIHDTIRGERKRLYSDTTNGDFTYDHDKVSFNSNGIQITTNDEHYNDNNETYVAWLWDAGSSTVSNTDGNVTSSVRANQAAGFSIVSFNLSVTNTEKSIGHGLNTAPTFYLIKNRSSTDNWYAYTTAIDGTLDFRYLNTTEAFSASSRTLPTSSVFYFASSTTGDHIAYCFAPVEGYSAIGTYTGNGASGYPNADGPFIYLGFRPAWVLWKCQSQVENWTIYDTARGPFNYIDNKLNPNSSAAESTNANHEIDFLSNGFKIRNNNGEFNQNNGTYLYVAFAENPFQANGGLAR